MSPQTNFTASSEAQLNADLALIDAGGADAASGTGYTITLSSSFTLNAALTAVNLMNSSSLTVVGGAFSINGANAFAGFDVNAGAVDFSNLSLENLVAQGGAGGGGAPTAGLSLLQGGGGGGGAGLGGAIFVASGASATLDNVTFSGNSATGGAGGIQNSGVLANATAGGGANGGAASGLVNGLVTASGGGGLEGGGGGGSTGLATGSGGSFGGGGGGGGGVSANGVLGAGGTGGFGGGGGGAGGGSLGLGVNLLYGTPGAGGFGGGTGSGADGGGGLGAGADVFVQTGGTLTVDSGSLGTGTVTGGTATGAAGAGAAFGSGIFEQSGTIAVAPASGQTATIAGVIADPSGSVAGSTGATSLAKTGAGTAVLGAANSFTGGDLLQAGTLELAASGSAGSGTITFAGSAATLKLDTNGLANTVAAMVPGDVIYFAVMPYVAGTSAATLSTNSATLTVTNGTITTPLTLSGVSAGTTFHTGPDGQGGTLVQIGAALPPTITAIASSPATGDLGVGQVVTLTLTPSAAVTVSGGTPSLTLNDGGTATYSAASSTSTALVFTYTVAAGQNAASLGVSGLNLNGATIADSVGNDYAAGSALPAYAGPQINTTAPSVTSLTSNPASGDFTTAKTITFTLATSAAVTGTAVPTLTLNDGGTATYSAAASTGTSLVFTYAVLTGQNVAALGVTSLNLNGGTLADGAGNGLNTTLPSYSGPKIDTLAPTIASIAANPASGTLDVGNTVTFTLTPSEAVNVAGGTPTLILNDGGTATYSAAASTQTSLVFTYTVATGQNAAPLGITALDENGATIQDLAGNNLNPAAPLPAFASPTVNTTAPDIIAIASNPATGDLDAGHTVTFTLTPSEAVTVTGGTPTLTLNDGGVATYNAGTSTTLSLVFTTTVAAGQNAAALGVTALNLNGASIKDSLGNSLNPSTPLPAYSGPQIDTTPPATTTLTSTPANGDLDAGKTVTLLLGTSEAVNVTGSPTLTLNDGGTATYNAASSTSTSLAFNYAVAAGQNVAALAVQSLILNGGSIADGAGNPLSAAAALPSYAGPKIDTTAPTITAVASNPAGGELDTGSVVTFTLTPSEAVTVSGGTPSLLLNDGGTATYNPGLSTLTSLVFTYTVAAGQTASSLGIVSLATNGATVADGAGNPLNPLTPLPGYSGPGVDTATPTITAIASTPATGDEPAGTAITLVLTPSEAVTVSGGIPTLTLNDGGTATYAPGSSTATALVFTTTVTAGQNAAALAIQSLNFNGATISDAGGNAMNPATTLPAYSGPQIDTTPPTITGIVSSPATGDLDAGHAVTFTLTPSEAVTVVGAPTLTLNDGGTATYVPASSTATALVFTTAVGAGQNAAALAVQSLNLNGGSISDGAGNPLAAAAALPSYAGPQIDTTPPTIVAIASNPASGQVGIGQVISFTLTPSEAVTVSGGAPSLMLNDGGTAVYQPSASSQTALVFSTTVANGQNAGQLAITALQLNGSAILDGAGNPLNPATPLPTYAGPGVTTNQDTVSSDSVSPATGDFDAGHVLTITLVPGTPVTVTGGTPTLLLNDGGVATYVAGASSANALVFTTTVAAGQNAASLQAVSIALNGATIVNASGASIDPTGLPALNGPQIDTTAPTVVAISSTDTPVGSPNATSLAAGSFVTITLTMSENVTVTGSPTLTLNDGGTATYVAASSTPGALVFSYKVGTGDNVANLGVTGVSLNGGAITDGAGNPYNPSAGTLPTYTGPQIDALIPAILSITAAPAVGPLDIGAVVTLTFTPNEPLYFVGGVPTINLNDGGIATYDPAISTPTAMKFLYTVAAGQNTPSLETTGFNANGSTTEDSAGNVLSAVAAANVPALNGPEINTAPPAIVSVTADPATGNLNAGKVVTLTVTLDKDAVITGGVPTLTLNDGGTAYFESSGSTPNTWLFTYTVTSGQNAADLAVQSLNLNGGTLSSEAGADTATAPVVPTNSGPTIDTTPPTVTGVAATPATGTYGLGATITITLMFSKNTYTAGGVPTLLLNDGGTAVYQASTSTPTAYNYTYVVAAGQDTPELTVDGYNLNGATIQDLAGNPFTLATSGTITTFPGFAGLAIDTDAPATPTLVLDPAASQPSVTGNAPANSTVAISVDGTPVGMTSADGNGNYTYALPASVPTGIDTVTAIATDSLGNPSAVSLPLLVAIGPVLDWVTPAAGAFDTSGLWKIAGVVTTTVPNASNTAEFNTGSAIPYIVSGSGTAGRINVIGDQVTATGQLATVGVMGTISGLATDLAITAGGLLDIAGGGFTAGHAVTLGGGSAGTLAVTGQGALTAPGFDLLNNGALQLDPSAALSGAVSIGGGSLLAVPLTGSSGIATLNVPLTLLPGTANIAGSKSGATLDLGGAIAGSGSLTVTGNLVLADAADSYSGGTVLDNASLVVAAAGAAGTGTISSLAGTANTITAGAGSTVINSNGLDTIILGPGTAAVTTTGGASIVGGSGNATLVGLGSADTVTGGSGSLAVSGTADLVESTDSGGNVTYSGTGRIIYVGSGSGSETVSAADGSTITTGSGANLVMLGGGLNVITSLGTDTIQAGSGTASITGSGSSIYIVGGAGRLVFLGGAGSSTVTGGTGSATLTGGGSGGVLTGGTAGHNLLAAGGGSSTVTGGGASDTIFGSAHGSDLLVATGLANTIVGGGNTSTLVGGGGGLLYGGSGQNTMFAGSADTLVGGSGSTTMVLIGNNIVFGGLGKTTVQAALGGKDTVIGGTGTTTMVLQGQDLAFAGPGTSTISAASTGSDTVVSGTGSAAMTLGGHDLAFIGGGTNVITAGSAGSDSIVAAGGMAVVTLAGSDLVFAGGGASTITGSAAGGDFVVGGSGSTMLSSAAGNETFFAGSGAATVIGGGGDDAVLGSTGSLLFVGGAGADQVALGSGFSTLTGGSGQDTYEFFAGIGNINDTINNFKVGTDHVAFEGYNPAVVAGVSITSTAGGTALALSDGTNIFLAGVTSLASNSILHG